MLVDKRLFSRIAVMAGLVCVRTKSRAFADHLIHCQTLDPEQVSSLSFREKDVGCQASHFSAKVYEMDGRGTSIAVIRSRQAHQLIEDGFAQAEVFLQPLAIEKMIASQAGVLEQKRKPLAARLWMAGRIGIHLRKRVSPVRPSWYKRLVKA